MVGDNTSKMVRCRGEKVELFVSFMCFNRIILIRLRHSIDTISRHPINTILQKLTPPPLQRYFATDFDVVAKR